MVQSPSWAADWLAASQEFPRISRNPKVNYRTHKRTPPVPILGQPNPVHMLTSYLLEIHPNIHPSTPRSPQWSLSLRFPHQDPIHPPLLTHTYLLTHSMVQSPSWEANWFAASQQIPRHLTEPDGSLPHSQASATCLYPGPAQSSPYTHIPPPGDPS